MLTLWFRLRDFDNEDIKQSEKIYDSEVQAIQETQHLKLN